MTRSICLVLALAACGSKKSNDPPPPQPATGAPIAFVVDKVTPGEDMKGGLDVREYNFSDKRVAQYGVLIRYYDAGGKVVNVKPGTPFEKSYDHWSFTGKRYLCEPKSWCSFPIDHLDVPAKAVKAEVLASRVNALKDDVHFEDKDMFTLEHDAWPGSENEPKPKPPAPDAFAMWDMAARTAAWQGAWAGDGAGLGAKAAWQIDGDKITFVDKKGEQKLTLDVDSPCTAGFGGGKDGGWVNTFTLQNGQLITGLGDAGSRKGDKAIVCGSGDIYTLDGTTCTTWSNHFGNKWESEPGTCGIKQDNGKDIFFYTRKGDTYEYKLPIDGDVIWSDQLKMSHAQKVADLAAAKAAQGL